MLGRVLQGLRPSGWDADEEAGEELLQRMQNRISLHFPSARR
jgi:hypothetical protein